MPDLVDVINDKIQQEKKQSYNVEEISEQEQLAEQDEVAAADQQTPQRPGKERIASSGSPRAILYELPGSSSGGKLNGEVFSRQLSWNDDELEDDTIDPERVNFNRTESDFKGALDVMDPEMREKEQQAVNKRARERERERLGLFLNRRFFTFSEDGHSNPAYVSPFPSPRHSLHEPGSEAIPLTKMKGSASAPSSPQKDGKPSMPNISDFIRRPKRQQSSPGETIEEETSQDGQRKAGGLFSGTTGSTSQRWAKLKSLLPRTSSMVPKDSFPTIAPMQVNIIDELLVGGLSTLLLRMWVERDEYDHRRVPVMLHRLKVRISDSLHPLKGSKAVFRIECEYADGAFRWVIYRQLRDFISLHTHYRVSNAYNRNIEAMPDFPITSLGYFNFLRRDGDAGEDDGDVTDHGQEARPKERRRLFDDSNRASRAEIAKKQREELERYLLRLIRTVMFHPTANRLCKFLELSALSVSLAHSGGSQAKAGMLRIEGVSPSSGAWGRKGVGWRDKKKSRWAVIRESYLVAVEDPSERVIWDCWLIDSDFRIERPKRYYRLIGATVDFERAKTAIEEKAITFSEELSNAGHHPRESTVSSTVFSGTVHSIKHGAGKLLQHRQHSEHDVERVHEEGQPETIGSSNGHRPRPRSNSSTSGSSINSSRPATPLLDPSTHVDPTRVPTHRETTRNTEEGEDLSDYKKKNADASRHTFYLINSQSKLKCTASTARQMQQWIAALERIHVSSHWAGQNRFGSFAPIRLNVAVQWLADGRDYFWNLSRALSLARHTIYIHDWWLSPELQLRRPNMPKWRLDNLLKRKAEQGVRIYLILYNEVSSRTTPTDSNYTKQRLIGLHPNIMVQRSPSHFHTGTFLWAHHEKLCVIDESIAFMGGLDACFGRWDTPQHILIDDPDLSGGDTIWPGKDYSNPRYSDFHTLHKPLEDMYDREKIPRMPWHDVSLQLVGQPARDLCRHFVQRWNFLLRIKNHSRKMPFLLPPSEFRASELTDRGLLGTCEVQICRSAGPWSLGTTSKIEHSIQDAYLKAIQLSQHFVYIENQFFITSTTLNNLEVENRIGDALVERIIRAHREGTKWKACIIIPLIPGFAYPVDHADASAVRIIMECQNRTISRGPCSIFDRLLKEKINPDDYIAVFALRGWGKLKGEVLTTEQVYVHGKVCIVDDQLAIIGSANINERSQRGDRDSELAAIIRDTDLLDSTMNGKPFRVGRFAHSLRIRLMREHLGVDVDAMYDEEHTSNDLAELAEENDEALGTTQEGEEESDATSVSRGRIRSPTQQDSQDPISSEYHSYTGTSGSESRTSGEPSVNEEDSVPPKICEMEQNLEEELPNKGNPTSSSKITRTPRQEERGNKHVSIEEFKDHPQVRIQNECRRSSSAHHRASKDDKTPKQPQERLSVDNSTLGERSAARGRSKLRKNTLLGSNPWTATSPTPHIDPHGFEDPISDEFWDDVWVATALHNTDIYRKVFRCVPDDTIRTWKQYREFVLLQERLAKFHRGPGSDHPDLSTRAPSEAGTINSRKLSQMERDSDTETRPSISEQSEGVYKAAEVNGRHSTSSQHLLRPRPDERPEIDSASRVHFKADDTFQPWEREAMEKLLNEVRGHLVMYPHRFLEDEDAANNFLFNSDRYFPLNIYV